MSHNKYGIGNKYGMNNKEGILLDNTVKICEFCDNIAQIGNLCRKHYKLVKMDEDHEYMRNNRQEDRI